MIIQKIVNKVQQLSRPETEKNENLSMNLRTKFILSFFLLVMFPLLLLGLMSYRNSKQAIEKNLYTLTLHNIVQISTNLDYYLKDIEFVTNLISSNHQICDYFRNIDTLSGNQTPDADKSGLQTLFNLITLRSDILSGIYYFNSDSIYFVHPVSPYSIGKNNLTHEDWYNKTMNNPEDVNLIGTQPRFNNSSSRDYVISTASALRDTSGGVPPGLFLLYFDYGNFIKVIDTKGMENYTGSTLYITDGSGYVMYSSNPSAIAKSLDSAISSKASDSSGSPQVVDIDGQSMYVVSYTSPSTSWKVVDIIPVKNTLKDIEENRRSILILAFVCLTIILVLSFVISSTLLKPIKKITSAMAEVERGNFSVRIKLKNKDETRILAESFNKMASNIDNLIKKVYHAQLRQKEAELTSLQNQINPHFLYNTLESIRGAALSYGIDSIAEMARCLSMLFRYNISERVLVTIREEIQHLDNYIRVQNFRHDDKFDIIYNIPEELYELSILKLTLQPLIENSIKHGLEMKMGKGCITITMQREGHTVKITIADNGSGIPEDKVKELNRILAGNIPVQSGKEAGTGTRIGVQNVNSRLKLIFGMQYGLKYTFSALGTIVDITIPVIEKKE